MHKWRAQLGRTIGRETIGGHEDNKVEPSKPNYKFLKGRVLSGNSPQPFEAAWIFQRFINLCMQFVVSFSEVKRSWYWTDVERGTIEQEWNQTGVVLAFSILSPLLFPIVYGFAAFVLIAFAPLSIPYIFKIKVDDAKEPTKPVEICVTMCKSVWYFAAGSFAWFYVLWPTSTFTCATEFTCEDVPFHIAPELVYSTLFSFMIAGFRYGREISASACDCACDRQKKILLNHLRYGKPLNAIIDKLSNRNDRLSFYPIFVKTEADEVVLQLSWKTEACLIACAGVHALLPVAWVAIQYHQPFMSLNIDYITAAMIVFGIITPFVEIRNLLRQLLLSLEEFQQCIDQLLITQYIASSSTGKDRATLKRSFVDAVTRNDEYRIRHHNSEGDVNYVALMEGEHRFGAKLIEEYVSGRFSEGGAIRYTKDELYDLNEFQVAFNFRRVEGVYLFRYMRKFLMIDILNERVEVEQFADFAINIIFVAMGMLLVLYLEDQGATCTWLMIPCDLTFLFAFLIRTFNLCIEANEYLFEENEIVLQTWLEHITQWDCPESEFEFPEEQVYSFKPGKMGAGITCDDSGHVLEVTTHGQAYSKGIKKGHQIVKVGSAPKYSGNFMTALDSAEKSNTYYEVTVENRHVEFVTRDPAVAWIWNTEDEKPQPVDMRLNQPELHRDKAYADDIRKAIYSMLKSCQILDSRQQILGVDITKEVRARLVVRSTLLFLTVTFFWYIGHQ